MENICTITLISENSAKTAQKLANDLKRFQFHLRRCQDCQGYYCPVLLVASAQIENALNVIDEAQSQPMDGF